MKAIVTAEEMQELDRKTIEDIGLPGAVLMETAGRAVAEKAMAMLDESGSDAARCLVVCAGGNNGGDGFVVARVLSERGYTVELASMAPREAFKGDAKIHMEAFLRLGGTLEHLAGPEELAAFETRLASTTLVVDALFGTGLDRPIEGLYAELIERINASDASVLAVDIPSGLRANDGAVLGVAVQANVTVTMAFAKIALASAPGFTTCGEVEVAEIGIPAALAWDVARVGLTEPSDLEWLRGEENANGHKGTRGHVLVVAGSPGTFGAGRLSGLAALRGGAGLVTVAGEEPDRGLADPLMSAALGDSSALPALLAGKHCVVMGPGMASGDAGAALVHASIEHTRCPLVLDADGLNHLGEDLEQLHAAVGPVVLTPHPGEAARLLGISTAQVQSDRIEAVRALAQRSRCIVVLKGARTLICDGRNDDGFVAINGSGSIELATAGSGDVLAGLIGALLSRFDRPLDAVVAAVHLHGQLGECARSSLGGPGVTASDLIDEIPALRARFEDRV